jgi:outer membrane protein, multidrug efflux system
LSDLIAEARIDNRDLAAATDRVMAAKAVTTIQRSQLFPQITADAYGTRGGGNTEVTYSQSYPTGNSFNLSFGASYELDFWGMASDNLRAAKESLKSANFARAVVGLTIDANIANEYLSVVLYSVCWAQV